MPLPVLAALAPAAIQTVGGLIANKVAGKQRVPDLVAPAINTAQAQLTDLEDSQRRKQALLEDQAARQGNRGFSTAAQEDLLNAGARGDATIRGGILDIISGARQKQELIEADMHNQQRLATIEGITGAFGQLSEGVGGLLNPVDVDAGVTGGAAQFDTSVPQLDFRPGQSLTNFSNPRSSMPSLQGSFANTLFKSLNQ